jgi:molybdate transport system substrate-binding protein
MTGWDFRSVQPLEIISSMAMRELIGALVSRYVSETGRQVRAQAAGGVDVAKRVRAGAPFDVVVLARAAIDALCTDGRLRADTAVDLVESGIAVAVAAGRAAPAIGTEDELKRAVHAARSLGLSTGPSGQHLERVFESWGMLAEIRSRIRVPPPGVPVAAWIADGTVDLGFQQFSELADLPGISIAGPLPTAVQSLTVFSGAVSVACSDSLAAQALLDFLASPAVAAVKRAHHMDCATVATRGR